MIKLIILLALASFAARALTKRWPWELWRDSERSQREAQARGLLGVSRDASRENIVDAHRRLITQVHPDRGGSSEQVHAANNARDVLLGQRDREQLEKS
jgi:DnaJ homolog subfamily C member 19